MLVLSTMPLKCQCNIKECIGGIVYYIKQKETNDSKASSNSFVPLSLRKCHFESKQKMEVKEDIITQYYESDESENVDVMYALPLATSSHGCPRAVQARLSASETSKQALFLMPKKRLL